MNHLLIGQLAAGLALLQIIPYIVSILRGHTKPERASYFIWLVVDVVTVSSYISVGARATAWTPVVLTLTGLSVFILSIKYGMGGFSHFDVMCLLLALGGAVVWIVTKDALLALCIGTGVNLIGYLPTIKKAYFLPKTENTLSWALCAMASTLNLFALTNLELRIAMPVILAAAEQGLIAYMLLFPKKRFKPVSHRQPHKVHAFLTHPVFAR